MADAPGMPAVATAIVTHAPARKPRATPGMVVTGMIPSGEG